MQLFHGIGHGVLFPFSLLEDTYSWSVAFTEGESSTLSNCLHSTICWNTKSVQIPMNFNGIFFSSKQFSVQASLNEERISIDYVNFNTWLGGFKREHCKTLSLLHAKENNTLGCGEIPWCQRNPKQPFESMPLAGHFRAGIRESEKGEGWRGS